MDTDAEKVVRKPFTSIPQGNNGNALIPAGQVQRKDMLTVRMRVRSGYKRGSGSAGV